MGGEEPKVERVKKNLFFATQNRTHPVCIINFLKLARLLASVSESLKLDHVQIVYISKDCPKIFAYMLVHEFMIS